MPSTIILLGAFLGLLVVSTLAWTVMFMLGLRSAHVPGGTVRKAAVVSALVFGLDLLIMVFVGAAMYFLPMSRVMLLVVASASSAVYVVGSWWLIVRVFNVAYPVAIRAWLPTLLAPLVGYAFSLFVFKPFVYDTFVIPANSMAPTIIGEHVTHKCPICGALSVGSTGDREVGDPQPANLICPNFHAHETRDYDKTILSSDRILVAKVIAPRRWDLVVFRYPDEPRQNYLKRLIGLPGETVTIVDGSVHINGAKIEPPAEIRGITYVSEFPNDRFMRGISLAGSPGNPAVLGPDEYFVLGDHTTASLDSRLWEHGAPGHPPYAVPVSYMIGTATHIYWPPERMRILR